MKKRGKQILAILAVIALLGIYFAVFFASIFDDAGSMKIFLGCVCTMIAVPIMLWGYLTLYRVLSGKGSSAKAGSKEGEQNEFSENEDSKKNK